MWQQHNVWQQNKSFSFGGFLFMMRQAYPEMHPCCENSEGERGRKEQTCPQWWVEYFISCLISFSSLMLFLFYSVWAARVRHVSLRIRMTKLKCTDANTILCFVVFEALITTSCFLTLTFTHLSCLIEYAVWFHICFNMLQHFTFGGWCQGGLMVARLFKTASR